MKVRYLGLSLAAFFAWFAPGYAHAYWKKVLTCDGGAAVVDVSLHQANYAQVVVRDPRIVSFVRAQGALTGVGAREIILQGLNGRDIHGGGDFTDLRIEDYRGPLAVAYREGNGLKVVFWKTYDPADGNSDCHNGYAVCPPPYQVEAANWYFRNCQ